MNDDRCIYPDCPNRRKCQKLCSKHYERMRVHGDPSITRNRERTDCTVDGCPNLALAKGLCNMHYKRVERIGSVDLPEPLDLVDRFLSKVNKSGPVPDYRPELGPCWLWLMEPAVTGYGVISIENQVQYAHRVSYELFVDAIPDGLTIDHLCRVQMCVNPAHLEPVTLAENTRREMEVRWGTTIQGGTLA